MKYFEYILVRVLQALFGIVPLGWNQPVAELLAFFIRAVIRYRVNVVRQNLQNSFPDYDDQRIQILMKEIYLNFACLWTELLQNERLTMQYIEKHIHLHNIDVIDEARKLEKGVIYISGHIGNFEWLGYIVSRKYHNLVAVMKPVRNSRINEFIIKRRERQGVQLVFTPGALKKCVEELIHKKSIALAVDQDAGQKGIFVNFFDQPASTATGTAQLHLHTGAPVIFCVSIRRKWGEFDLYFERIPDFTGSIEKEHALFEITQTHTKMLEEWVRRYPGQYFWTHKRWKTVPNPSELEEYNRNLNTFI